MTSDTFIFKTGLYGEKALAFLRLCKNLKGINDSCIKDKNIILWGNEYTPRALLSNVSIIIDDGKNIKPFGEGIPKYLYEERYLGNEIRIFSNIYIFEIFLDPLKEVCLLMNNCVKNGFGSISTENAIKELLYGGGATLMSKINTIFSELPNKQELKIEMTTNYEFLDKEVNSKINMPFNKEVVTVYKKDISNFHKFLEKRHRVIMWNTLAYLGDHLALWMPQTKHEHNMYDEFLRSTEDPFKISEAQVMQQTKEKMTENFIDFCNKELDLLKKDIEEKMQQIKKRAKQNYAFKIC